MDNSEHQQPCPCAWCEVDRQNAEMRAAEEKAPGPSDATTCSVAWWVRQDWSKTDRQIAEERGISRQAVNMMRRKLKAGKAPKPPKPLNKRDALRAAHEIVGEMAHWGNLGVDEYLPAWAQKSWDDFQERVDALLIRWPNV
jgi:hypothetical protein